MNADDVAALLEHSGGTVVSIYLPTHRSGPETRQDPIRLKNLLSEARAELVELGMRGPEADRLLEPARALVEDHNFWQHQSGGLGLFLDDGMRSYRVQEVFEAGVMVGDAFHVKPLLRVMSRGEQFNVLALSENQVRLLWGTRDRVGQVDLPDDVPESLAAALWFEDPERQLQFRQAARADAGKGAIFHGHGGGKDQPHEELERFFRAVDGGVRQLLRPDVPLVLAGVERLLPIYRRVTAHDLVMDDEVTGNPDRLTPEELHARAWEIARPWFDRERQEVVDILVADAERRIDSVPEAIAAARAGRVGAVIVASDAAVWGDPGTDDGGPEVHDERQAGDRDLLDVVVADTWTRSGGSVWVVPSEEMPGSAPVAALLRY
ncbi:MAG TPA: hypothetical protein VK960_05980 [Acidimicrobiia bacterium]|nr:hypothetical protein [Acidimicrobiia bacterium]